MKIAKAGMAVSLSVTLVIQPFFTGGAVASDDSITPETSDAPAPATLEPRELTGEMAPADEAEPGGERKDELAEDGTPYAPAPLSVLPEVDRAVSARAAALDPDELIRVIVYLDYLPHGAIATQVEERHAARSKALRDQVAAILERYSPGRADATKDADNYAGMFAMSAADEQAMTALHEQHEALSRVIHDEIRDRLAAEVSGSQEPVVQSIEGLGGTVEFTTIAGNTVVALVPAGSIDRIADLPGVLRIGEDRLAESHLNVADDATLVTSGAAGGSLWDNSQTGGIYDPAVIDSGIDLTHPAIQDNASRANFSSWYVVAGVGSASYDETCCSIDDFQGHGTHVSGIVSSYGSAGFTSHLGMAYGVDKMVHLKAGWLNTSGRASMFWSDKYNLTDRALYNNDALSPSNSFLDDLEGINLSYGGDTSLDDTDAGRFWDSVVSTYPDIVVTISAGNSGPNNTLFSDPATSYNAITVANAQDQGTTSRTDDTIWSSSTRGPTANGRRKPDLAAHGTSITAPNTFWEGGTADMIAKTGTSMAAPMVQGVAMDLMDAGVFDELQIKALLINTAQKNEAGINIEGDSDGWDPAAGWGLMNAYAAYFHRGDVRTSSVTPNDTAGEFRLWKGVMEDEGASGEGRDRATMVWNRIATYNTAAAPSTYYNNVDLNLRLYEESNNFLIDTDLTGSDNVQQVRIGSGAGPTDVIVKTYAWSTVFDHGGTTHSFALATEEGFTEVDFPTTFQGVAIWPTEVEPNEEFDYEFWIRNDSEIASHSNTLDLTLPAGWTLVSGTDTVNVGSAAGGGGDTAHYTWRIRAQGTEQDGVSITVKHSHDSYLEDYGPFNWNAGLNVRVDNTPPSPDPMSFSTFPFEVDTSQITMTASFASDVHDPVEYYLDYTGSNTGGLGGSDSGWQSSRDYTDLLLSVNHEYCYRAWARDNAAFPNQTAPSAIDCDYTSIETPDGVIFGVVTTTSIQAQSSSTPSGLARGSSGLRVSNTTIGADSGWSQSNILYNSVGLTPNTSYTFVARARNGDATETSNSPAAALYTLANPPASAGFGGISATKIEVLLNANGNPAETSYLIENTTSGNDSGYIAATSWTDTGLECDTSYNYQARAVNGDGVETIIVPLGIQSTDACVSVDTDEDGIDDALDNCTLVANPDQRDTDGDNIGNICDGDLDNDCSVNFVDLGIMKSVFFTADADADLDGDGTVSFVDLGIFKSLFFSPPGPSAAGCN